MRIMAQERSAPEGRRHQAAVLLPPAEPSERQVRLGPRTTTCPVEMPPRGPPIRRTSASRASIAEALGQGWLVRQVSSISRAAIPAMRTCGPSAHQTGPSPSQTWVGVQVNVCPAATIEAARMTSIRRTSLAQRAAEPQHSANDIDGAFFEASPTRIGRIVTQHRDPFALRFDRHALDVEHIIHAQDVDSVA